MEILIGPKTRLFNLIYTEWKFPKQWSIGKIIPLFKKGSKTNIKNYRLIANICSMTDVYDQLIMERLKEFESKVL